MRLTAIISFGLLLVMLAIACQDERTIEFNRYYSSGAAVYQQHCQNCHGGKGEGLSALIPPLTDSVFLKTNRRLLACYIKNGLKGEITVNGKTFNEQMPPADLSTMQTAQVITYICNSFGNKGGLINADMAAADLKNCR